MSCTANQLSLQEFLDLPESDERFELVDGELIAKMAPTTPHSRVQKRLLRLIDDWCEQTHLGEVNPEWTVVLKRRGVDWAPVPDLVYISWSRISADWNGEGPCPGIPELVVEIISPGQTFGEMIQKATDYLLAGVDQIWIADTKAQAITVFERDRLPQTFWVDSIISTHALPNFLLKISDLFSTATRRT